ncbi:DUF2842 domain-containing protein [Caulobacter segnis]
MTRHDGAAGSCRPMSRGAEVSDERHGRVHGGGDRHPRRLDHRPDVATPPFLFTKLLLGVIGSFIGAFVASRVDRLAGLIGEAGRLRRQAPSCSWPCSASSGDPHERSSDSARLRKLIGSIGVMVVLFAWIWAFARPVRPPAARRFVHLVYFVALGMGWVLPVIPVISWMGKADKPLDVGQR